MSFKEVSCTISQFIKNDILESFETKGIFAQLHGPSLAVSPRILFLCRFPSMVNTERFSRNLFVVGEDEFQNIYVAVSGKHPFDISVLFSSLSLLFYDSYPSWVFLLQCPQPLPQDQRPSYCICLLPSYPDIVQAFRVSLASSCPA